MKAKKKNLLIQKCTHRNINDIVTQKGWTLIVAVNSHRNYYAF